MRSRRSADDAGGGEQGSAVVEFVLALPLLLLVPAAVLSLMGVVQARNRAADVAGQAARAAARCACPSVSDRARVVRAEVAAGTGPAGAVVHRVTIGDSPMLQVEVTIPVRVAGVGLPMSVGGVGLALIEP